MSIITKPLSIVKNSAAEFTLDKAALAAVASVAANAYYSVSSNWSKVILQYKSSAGNQKELLEFNASLATPTSSFLVSSRARDIFQVNKIVIVDFDGGTFIVPRSQLTTSEFDIDTTPVALEFFSQPLGVDTYTVTANSVVKSSGADAYNSSIISTASISGDGYIQVTNASQTGTERLLVGMGKNPRSGNYVDIEYCFNNGDVGYGIYESGTLSYVSPVIPAEGDILKITRVSNVVKYYINGNLAYTSTVPASGSYYIETSLYDIGSAITNCSVVDAAAPTILYTRDFVAQNSLQSYENFNTSFGGSYSFVAGGLSASTGAGGYIDLLNNNFAGASLPTATYKLRVHIASYTGEMTHMDLGMMDNNLMPIGGVARVTHAEILASVGGYVERTIVGLSQSAYLLNLEPYGGTATIVISKIELIAV